VTAWFNVGEWLLDRNVDAGDGERVAISSGDDHVTYGQLLDRVRDLSAGLRQAGVRREERIAMVVLDSVEYALMFLAAVRIGAIPVPVNPLLPPRDVSAIASAAGARLVVVSAQREATAAALELDDDVRVVVTGSPGWMELTSGDGAHSGDVERTVEDSPAFWLCTSGTTGRAKLVMHRHADAPYTCATFATEVLEITRDDCCYSVGPMFHAYGLGNSLVFPFSVAARSVVDPTRPLTPALVAGLLQRAQPTLFFCVPTFYGALTASDIADDSFLSVRRAVSAAEQLPAEVWRRFADRFGVEILDAIGSTEMTHCFISNRQGDVRPGSSGRPVRGYDVRLLDDRDLDADDGTPGHLLVRGESAATGYWCDAATSRRTFAGEWVRTGDTYIRDVDGYYTYLGRSDDMLRVAGEWVSPVEVEGVLVEHEDVLEAAVVGERDATGTHRPVAFVVPRPSRLPTPEALVQFCATRLAGYKRPKRVVVTDKLPKTATGKIKRHELADDVAAGRR
jgi:benzoate-CoA ligase family protein